jgi:hypothetical protein
MNIRQLLCLLLFQFFVSTLFAKDISFVKEYIYRPTKVETKKILRMKSLRHVKNLLVDELSNYVYSYLNYDDSNKIDNISKTFLLNEIKNLDSKLVKLRIEKEKWIGNAYSVKAKIDVDPENILNKINQSLTIRRQSEEVEKLKKILNRSNTELDSKNKRASNFKHLLIKKNKEIESATERISIMNKECDELEKLIQEYQQQELSVKLKLIRIEKTLDSITMIAVSKVRLGMTIKEVESLCGLPRSKAPYISEATFYNYGKVWVMFESDVVSSVFNSKYYEGILSFPKYRSYNTAK